MDEEEQSWWESVVYASTLTWRWSDLGIKWLLEAVQRLLCSKGLTECLQQCTTLSN